MKKTFLITAGLVIALTASGCGNKTNKSNNAQNAAEGTVEQQLADFGKNASDNVDMNKIDGQELKAAENDGETKGKIGSYEVSVDKAKVIDYQDSKVVLVSFEFKNNSSAEVNFSGVMSVNASQGDTEIPSAVVVGVEGFDATTLAQNVSKGEKINVQRAYKLADEETPVTIHVEAFDRANNEGAVEKTFNIK